MRGFVIDANFDLLDNKEEPVQVDLVRAEAE